MISSLVAASTLLLGAQALRPTNIMRRDGALTALKYTSVGGIGSYNMVTDIEAGEWPSCTVDPYCITETYSTSGALAPFDDEITFAMRGPMNIQNIAVYQPTSNSTTWILNSTWAVGSEPENLAFLGNYGGSGSGTWSICAGASQAFVNSTFDGGATTLNEDITSATGNIPAGSEINILTATPCDDSTPCTGFYRGEAYHGWNGSKMLVMTFDMPSSDSDSDIPALWALNAQVVRAEQYGCNCRGTGGTGTEGGCGELDILEVISGDSSDEGFSEIYSYKISTGSGTNQYFPRPTDAYVTYGIIFDTETDSIMIQEFTEWDYTQTSVTRSLIEGYLDTSDAATVSMSTDENSRRSNRRSIFGAHRRRQNH